MSAFTFDRLSSSHVQAGCMDCINWVEVFLAEQSILQLLKFPSRCHPHQTIKEKPSPKAQQQGLRHWSPGRIGASTASAGAAATDEGGAATGRSEETKGALVVGDG